MMEILPLAGRVTPQSRLIVHALLQHDTPGKEGRQTGFRYRRGAFSRSCGCSAEGGRAIRHCRKLAASRYRQIDDRMSQASSASDARRRIGDLGAAARDPRRCRPAAA